MRNEFALVSIVITTKNEKYRLPACLKSINKQTYKYIEIIVIDNNSTDQTKDIAKSFGVQVFDKGPERSAQRNFGASHAKGDYLLFLDADMELTPEVVGECVKKIHEPRPKTYDLKALVIPEKSIGIGFWAQCKALERSFYLNVPWIESARFLQKKAFYDVGGYDEKLTGPEDFELPQRLKMTYGEECVGRISSFILHNEGKLSLGKTLKKKYYYGKKMSEYRKKQSSKGYFDKQASMWMRYRLFFSKSSILLHDPITFMGMLVLKTLEMGAMTVGAISV